MTNQTQTPVVNTEQATTPRNNPSELPKHGVSRERQLLPFLPFSSSTLWEWSSKGKFIKPVKLSPTMTVWDNSKVHKWLENISKGYSPELATQLAETSQKDIEGV